MVKNRQNQGVFAIFVTKMCTDMVVIGVRVHQQNIKHKVQTLQVFCSLNHEKPNFVLFPLKSTGWVAMTPRTFDF